MAVQGSHPRPGPSSSAAGAKLPRPTSPDLQTDSDDDASTSSDSDEDLSYADLRNRTDSDESTAHRDRDGDLRDDFRKPPPRNRDEEEDLVRAVQERIRVQSLLYDTPSLKAAPTRQTSTAAPLPPISRAHLRLALSTLRARQFLAARSFSHLSTALTEISKALLSLGGPDTLAARTILERGPEGVAPVETTAPTRGKPNFGVFIPILARLVKDVRTTLSAEGIKGREFRRSELRREEAKALVALRQRWVKPSSAAATGGKSTGRGKRDRSDLEWVDMVEKLVAEHPPPPCLLPTANNKSLAEEDHDKTSSLLTSIEQLLLPAALPRISLAALDLDDHDLAGWSALEGMEDVVRWYLSFGYKRRQGDEGVEKGKAREVLDGVKVLDLSHNRLADFPRHLVRLFPHLEALSLSHNRFTRLPPWITLFASLCRLEADHNPLSSLEANRNPKSKPRRGRAAAEGKLGGVHANAREMYPLVEDAVRRTVAQVSRAELLLSLRSHHHPAAPRRLGGAPLGPAAESAAAVPPPPRSLFSLSVELAQTHLLSSSQRDTILDNEASTVSYFPSHLLEVVTTSYRCISCDRFVVVTTMPDASAWFVPPFWERVHFLNPGIVVVVTSSRDGSRRRDRTRRRRRQEDRDDDDGEEEEEHVEHLDVDFSSSSSGRGDSGAGKSATLEQRLLLAVLARQEGGSLPPSPDQDRPDPPSTTANRRGTRRSGRHKNAASASRFFDSDYGCHFRRDRDDAEDDPAVPTAVTLTFVVGGRGPHGVGSRFCSLCAASHLGVLDAVLATLARERDEGSEDRRDVVASWRCGCEMCEEERRVRGTASEGEGEVVDERSKVVRWLRRYDAVRST